MNRHWSVDEEAFKKRDPVAYQRWKLVQQINYGLEGKKLSKRELTAAWVHIREDLDPLKAETLAWLVWGTKPTFHHYKYGSWSWS